MNIHMSQHARNLKRSAKIDSKDRYTMKFIAEINLWKLSSWKKEIFIRLGWGKIFSHVFVAKK